MCRSLLIVKIVTKSRPGTTVSTMPAHAAERLEERGFGDRLRGGRPAGRSAGRSVSVGLSRDVTGYSCPSGRSSYLGLNSTRRPWLMEIRPEAMSLRPGSMPDDGAAAQPDHVQRGGAVEQLRLQRGHSGPRPQGDRAQGTSHLDDLAVVAVADPRAARGLRVLCSSSECRSSWEQDSRSSIRRKRPAGVGLGTGDSTHARSVPGPGAGRTSGTRTVDHPPCEAASGRRTRRCALSARSGSPCPAR